MTPAISPLSDDRLAGAEWIELEGGVLFYRYARPATLPACNDLGLRPGILYTRKRLEDLLA